MIERDIHFLSHGVRLDGTLCLPLSQGLFPVVLMVHGKMEIGEGTQAMAAWRKLTSDDLTADQMEQTRTALLKYCELDTWAMVKIFQVLQEKAGIS